MDKNTALTDHRSRYKNSRLDAKELRRRREEDSFKLRRQKRDDVLIKRRTINEPVTTDSCSDTDTDTDNEEYNELEEQVINGIKQSEDLELIRESVKKIRKVLSKENPVQFDEVIKSGLVSRFIELLDLKSSDQVMLVFEVIWILTNICSGTKEHTKHVVDAGGVPKLVGLLNSPDIRIVEQSIWALGNIIGDGEPCRDLVISCGFLPLFITHINADAEIELLRNATWVLVNICRNKEPPPALEVIQQIIPSLEFLIESDDLAILIDCSWAVSYITELGQPYAQLIIDSGLLPKLVPLVNNDEIKVQTAAIRSIGSIVTGSETQTQAIIDAGSLYCVLKVFKDKQKDKLKDRILLKEVLWFVSNVAAGSTSQIQRIIDSDLMPEVIWCLKNGGFSQQKEALWVIYNMSLTSTYRQLDYLINLGVIPALCGLLGMKDNMVVRNALEALKFILGKTHTNNPDITTSIEECGGLDKIEELQSNPNCEIYNFSYHLIENYFSNSEAHD